MNAKWLLNLLAAGALLVIGQAQALTLTPATSGVFGVNFGPANCEPGCVYTAFGLPNDGSLDLLYKADVVGSDGVGLNSGDFAASYQTTFNNSPADPADAVIAYVSGAAIACPSCYLAIKDGNHNPSYYFYNLSAWNGTEDIVLRGFWPAQGAISHVSIWGPGGGSSVPEPGPLALFGLGLVGLAARRRRKTA